MTAEQLRAARAALRMEQIALAELADVSVETIKRLEKMQGELESTRVATIQAIRRALEGAGIEFLDGNGVRIRKSLHAAE